MNAPKWIVVLLVFYVLLVPASALDSHPTYSIEVDEGYITIPELPDVGNLTGIFITHNVTYKEASLNTPQGTLYIEYGEASRNRAASYGFSFLITELRRDSSYEARIVGFNQTVSEHRGTFYSTINQAMIYKDGSYTYVGKTNIMRDTSGNFSFFFNGMYLKPGQVVRPTITTFKSIITFFYVVGEQTDSIDATLTITLEVNNETYSLELDNHVEIYSPEVHIYLGNNEASEANVVVGERVPFRIEIENPPALHLTIASQYANFPVITLPNLAAGLDVPLNVSYPLPTAFGTGGLVGQALTNQAIYVPSTHTLALFLPITSQQQGDLKIYVYYPKAYRFYYKSTGGFIQALTGVVRAYVTITLHAHSEYESKISTIALIFVIILVLITIVTLRIFLRTMRS